LKGYCGQFVFVGQGGLVIKKKNGTRYFLASERTGETDENINYYDK